MMTPEERASDLVKWVAADLRPRQWTVIRDALLEVIAEEREACARAAEAAVAAYAGAPPDLAAHVATAIRAR